MNNTAQTTGTGADEQVALSTVEEERPPMIEIPEYREKFHP